MPSEIRNRVFSRGFEVTTCDFDGDVGLIVMLVMLVVVVHGMHVRWPAPRWSRSWEQRDMEDSRDEDHERIAWLAQQLPFCLGLMPVADAHPDRLVAHSTHSTKSPCHRP